MKVLDVMSSPVVTIWAGDSCSEAARRLLTHRVGALPVIDEERLVGVVTDRDLLIRVVAAGRDPVTTAVADVMSQARVVCDPDLDVEDACQLMRIHHVRRLPVVTGEDHVLGMVSLTDLAASTIDDRDVTAVLAESRHDGG